MLLIAKRTGRRGFTLVEMLVVIAIIAILMSLTGVAVFRLIGVQQSANTKSELSRMESEFKVRWRQSADKYVKEPIPTTGPKGSLNDVYYNTVLPMAGGDRERARVIWTKLRLKQAFPNNFAEALSTSPLSPDPYYATALGNLGYTTTNTTPTKPWESSVCLLLALQRGEDGSTLKLEDLGVSSSIHDFGPTPNGQTVKGLVDGWGNPLYFVRWPVMLSAPNYGLSGTPQAKFNDPGDPTGLLAAQGWQNSAGAKQFVSFCHPLADHTKGGEPQTYLILPVIASGGANGRLGYDKGPPPTNVPSPAFDSSVVQTTAGSLDADDLIATLSPAQ